jgi:tetratricopeptide (TPR) repeat protein
MRFSLASCSAILLLGAPLLAQRPEARRHLAQGVGLYHEHDDSGDALVAAQAEFAAALRLEPRYCAARAYQGLIDLENNHDSDAEAAFREALSWDPKCAEALVGQARLNQKAHPPREWLPLLRQAVAVAPRNKLARWDLAYALTAEAIHPTPEMWKEAMECWRVLIALDRNDRDAHYDLARALPLEGSRAALPRSSAHRTDERGLRCVGVCGSWGAGRSSRQPGQERGSHPRVSGLDRFGNCGRRGNPACQGSHRSASETPVIATV